MSNILSTPILDSSRLVRTVNPTIPSWLVNPNERGEMVFPEHNNVEYVARLFDVVKDYFRKCRAHVHLNLNDTWNDTMYIFSDSRSMISSTRFRIIRTARLPRLTDYSVYKRLLYGKFFDQVADKSTVYENSYDNETHRPTTARSALESMIINEELSNEENGIDAFVNVVDAIKIVMRVSVKFGGTGTAKRGHTLFIGLYIPDKNILIVGDWSHSAFGISFTKILLEPLIDRLDLIPLKRLIVRKRRRPKVAITLGSDPEFELINRRTNSIVSASGIIRDDRTHNGNIGRDGAGNQVELRPIAQSTPEDAVSVMRGLVSRFFEVYPNYDLGVAGHRYPLGGHIHIGVGHYYSPPPELLLMLDDFIGAPTINLSGKARGGYKSLGKIETKNWGFEYRSAPALIFMNPQITKLVYKIAQNITSRFVNGSEQFKYNFPIGKKELVEIAGLTNDEAHTYLSFIINILTRVGGRGDRMLLEWEVEKPEILQSNTVPPYSSHMEEGDEVADEEYIEPRREMRIAVRDDWELRVKNLLLTALRRIRPNHITRNVDITLFGYRRNRGFTSNLRVPAPAEITEYLADIHRINDEDAVANGSSPLGVAPVDTVFRVFTDHPVITRNDDSRIIFNIGLPNLYRQDISVARNLTTLIVDAIIDLLLAHGAVTDEARVTQTEEVQYVCDSGV